MDCLCGPEYAILRCAYSVEPAQPRAGPGPLNQHGVEAPMNRTRILAWATVFFTLAVPFVVAAYQIAVPDEKLSRAPRKSSATGALSADQERSGDVEMKQQTSGMI